MVVERKPLGLMAFICLLLDMIIIAHAGTAVQGGYQFPAGYGGSLGYAMPPGAAISASYPTAGAPTDAQTALLQQQYAQQYHQHYAAQQQQQQQQYAAAAQQQGQYLLGQQQQGQQAATNQAARYHAQGYYPGTAFSQYAYAAPAGYPAASGVPVAPQRDYYASLVSSYGSC